MPAKNILLLEDELLIAEALEHILREEGYAVDVAITVAEAKVWLRSVHYDVVIADWRLPDGDGILIANLAAQLGSKTFVMSGNLFAIPEDRVWNHEILTKPVQSS